MIERYGIILLDGNEIIVRIYEKNEHNRWQLVRYQTNDLTTFTSKKHIEISQIIETIAQISLSQYAAHVTEWKICARNVTEDIVQNVSTATSIKAELLTLVREQELVCKGMLLEIQ